MLVKDMNTLSYKEVAEDWAHTCVTVAYAKLTTLKLVDFTHLVTKIEFSGEVFDLFSYFKKDNEPR